MPCWAPVFSANGVGEDGGYLPHRVGVRGAGNGLNHELQTVKGGHVPTT